eukprot:TRINITY_DN9265_c1_g6_i1.p1 TRINITY_DN9265_c1_g6~~TRINITY_DN9265_c1_g6_i1.p1  ORF type:complete len:437 (+),score=59.53 TRINITY_DN9265_c1_g6_i1:88-1398(+)
MDSDQSTCTPSEDTWQATSSAGSSSACTSSTQKRRRNPKKSRAIEAAKAAAAAASFRPRLERGTIEGPKSSELSSGLQQDVQELVAGTADSQSDGGEDHVALQDDVMKTIAEAVLRASPADPKGHALSLVRSRECGRYFVAGRSISAGELVLEAEPHVLAVQESLITRVCAWCARKAVSAALPISCSSCSYVHYCSSECQDSGAIAHGRTCEALRRLRANPPKLDREAMTLLRLVLYEMYERHETEVAPQNYTKFLCTGLEAFAARKDFRKIKGKWQTIAAAAANVCSADGLSFETDDVIALLGAISSNGFGIWEDGRKEELARALSVASSFFNHSCAPNIARLQYGLHGRRMQFFALKDILEGEPVCFSYIDPTQDKVERRSDLSAWGFTCRCPRCEGSNDAIEVNVCSKSHLGYMIPGPSGDWCTICSQRKLLK